MPFCGLWSTGRCAILTQLHWKVLEAHAYSCTDATYKERQVFEKHAGELADAVDELARARAARDPGASHHCAHHARACGRILRYSCASPHLTDMHMSLNICSV